MMLMNLAYAWEAPKGLAFEGAVPGKCLKFYPTMEAIQAELDMASPCHLDIYLFGFIERVVSIGIPEAEVDIYFKEFESATEEEQLAMYRRYCKFVADVVHGEPIKQTLAMFFNQCVAKELGIKEEVKHENI